MTGPDQVPAGHNGPYFKIDQWSIVINSKWSPGPWPCTCCINVQMGGGRGDYNYRNQDGGGHCGGKSAPDRNERYKGQAGSGIMSNNGRII